jgi:hypothetical protein
MADKAVLAELVVVVLDREVMGAITGAPDTTQAAIPVVLVPVRQLVQILVVVAEAATDKTVVVVVVAEAALS